MQAEKQNGTMTVKRQFLRKGNVVSMSQSDETIEIRAFQGPHAKVRFGLGFTKNLGNFESLRIDVGIEMPCYPEEYEEAMDFVVKTVDERLWKEFQEQMGGRG